MRCLAADCSLDNVSVFLYSGLFQDASEKSLDAKNVYSQLEEY